MLGKTTLSGLSGFYTHLHYLCRRKFGIRKLEDSVEICDLRSGNHRVYEGLFSSWYVPLCNYAYSMLRDRDEAEDVVQRVFYKLWDQREDLEVRTSMKSYLYRMAHNECLNRIKQNKIRAGHNEYIAYETPECVNATEEAVMRSELQRRIEEAMDKLPPRCREVFEKSRFRHMSYLEISQDMHITTNTVETQVVKALRMLRVELKDYLSLLILLGLFEEIKF